MPRYSYRCSNCNETFEVIHSMKSVLSECKICESQNTVKRVPSKVSVNSVDKEKESAKKNVESALEEIKDSIKEEKKNFKNKGLNDF